MSVIPPDKLIMIAGFARGGTTWLRRTVGFHPQICPVPGEIKFNELALPRKIGFLPPKLTRDMILDAIDPRVPETYRAGELGVVKGPSNSLVFKELVNALPEAKFVYIVRDPRDVFVSHLRGKQEWMNRPENRSIDGCMRKTRRYYDGFLKAGSPANVHTLRYEDLHQDFKATASRMFDFLGADCDNAVIEDIRARTAFQSWTGRNHEEDRTTGARKGVIGDWVNHLTDAHIDWFKSSDYWSAFFETYGYRWEKASVRGFVEALHARRQNARIVLRLPAVIDDATATNLRAFLAIADTAGIAPQFLIDGDATPSATEQAVRAAVPGWQGGEEAFLADLEPCRSAPYTMVWVEQGTLHVEGAAGPVANTVDGVLSAVAGALTFVFEVSTVTPDQSLTLAFRADR